MGWPPRREDALRARALCGWQVAAAFAAARAGTLAPSPAVSRAGLLLREPPNGSPPQACYAVLTGPRLLLFGSGVHGVQQHGHVEAVLTLSGLTEDVARADAPRFSVSHAAGRVVFLSGSVSERGEKKHWS